jgi:hypothetical protein
LTKGQFDLNSRLQLFDNVAPLSDKEMKSCMQE